MEHRNTLRPREGYPSRSGNRDGQYQGGKPIAKGHDAVLKALQDSKREATIVTLSGEKFIGTIVGRDKYTITLLVINIGSSVRHVFYKHAIERFYGQEASMTTDSGLELATNRR